MKKKITSELDEDYSILDKLMKETPLEIRLKVLLRMEDLFNWDNGVYLGDKDVMIPRIIETVEKWIKDGMPK